MFGSSWQLSLSNWSQFNFVVEGSLFSLSTGQSFLCNNNLRVKIFFFQKGNKLHCNNFLFEFPYTHKSKFEDNTKSGRKGLLFSTNAFVIYRFDLK